MALRPPTSVYAITVAGMRQQAAYVCIPVSAFMVEDPPVISWAVKRMFVP